MISIRVAYYRKKDWKRFIEMIDDREKMHNTWHEWNKDFEKTKRELRKMGFEVEDFVVDLKELGSYCSQRGIKNDGNARAQFVQEK